MLRFCLAAITALSASGALAQQTVPAPVPQPAPQAPAATQTQQQQMQVDIPAPWRIECANSGTALDCQTSQAAVLRQNQQMLATVTLRVPPGGARPVLLVQVPLGVRVTDPVMVSVDESTPERLTVQGCTPNGCFAGGPAEAALVERLRTGQNVRISFANLGGDTVAVTMPLRGFALAHDKIR